MGAGLRLATAAPAPSAVNRRRDSEAAHEIGFALLPVLEAGRKSLRAGLAAGELIEELPVAALRRAEIGEETRDLWVFDDLQEPGESLAAPRLDHGAEKQTVDLRPGLAAENDLRLQALSPGVLPPSPERPAPLFQDRHHPPEMLYLLRRELRGALDELGVLGIVAGERQGVHGDLLFADRVIGQELGQAR